MSIILVFRYLIIFLLLYFFQKFALYSQSHAVRLEQVRGLGDSLFVDVYIKTDSLNFYLGSSNFVFQVSNPAAFVSVDVTHPNGPKIIERGVWDQSASDPSSLKSYLPMTLSNIVFPANTLNLSVLSKTSCSSTPPPPCGVIIPNSFTKVARILFKVADCNAVSSMNWLTNRGVFNDFQGNQVPRAAFNYQSSTNFSLCPIQINGIIASDADTIICPKTPYSFSLLANNADSYQLSIDGVPTSSNLTGSWATDTFTTNHLLQLIAINNCGCQDTAIINLQVIFIDTNIVLPNPVLACTNQNVNVSLSTSQNGASYYLTSNSDGSTIISNTVVGTGGGIVLNVPQSNLVPGANPIYLWALFNGCLVKIDSSTINNQVPPNTVITGNSTVLISSTGNYSVSTPNINSTYTWSIVSSIGSTVTPSGSSATVNFGASAGTDSLFVTELDNITGCSAQDTFVINVINCNALATGEANDTLVCENTNFPLYFTTFIGDSIQWQESSDGINWVNSVNLGNNGQVLLAGPLTSTRYYRAIAYGSVCNDTTNVIQVDVAPYPVSGVASLSTDTICSGDDVDLIVTGNNGNVQWQSSPNGIFFWTDVPGATTSTYTFTNLTSSTYFRAVNVTCDTAITNVVFVKVLTPASGSFNTAIPSVCAGGLTIPLGATISGDGAVGVWSTTGAGTFTNPNNPNAQYISSILDANSTVTLTWTVSTPNCPGSQSYSQNVLIGGSPQAIVNPIQPSICGTNPSAPLGASAVNGTGQWFLGTNANGTFVNSSDPNTVYIPSPLDPGNIIELLWVVTSPGCPSDTAKTYINVGTVPSGSFNTAVPNICAGDATIPLGATVTVGTGFWITPDGAGSFSSFNNPNATYQSVAADAGKKITLTWVVTSGGCPPVTYSQIIQVDEPPQGSFSTNLDSICAGGSSKILNATVTIGGGIWSTNGQGTFSSFGSPTAVYYSSLADAGQIINITWTIGNGVCDSISFTQPLKVLSDSIIGSFSTLLPPICAGETSIPLGATVGGGSTGSWSTLNGLGFFSNINDPNAVYISSPFDQGQIKLVWTVSKANCANLVIEQEITVFPKPIGIFNTNQGAVCENDTTDLLVGYTSVGTSYFSHNGYGNLLLQFNLGNSQGVRYEPSPLDVGDTIEIYWITQNGVCKPDTITRKIPVSPIPLGSFNTVVPDICAGALTIPLGATVVNGVGEWSTPDGQGSFGDKNDPNTFYNSNLADSGQTVTLVWTVKSAGCDSVQYTQTVNVLNTKVYGTFDFQPAPICAGDATAPLGATAVHGTGTWSTNGLGFFVPNASDPNAQYFSLASEAGDTIDLVWTISNPPCNDLPLKQKLIILSPPDGDFPVAPDTICFGTISPPLGATTNVGIGTWQVIQGTGNVNDVTNPNAFYIPGPGDAASEIKLAWVVQNGSCPPDVNIQNFFVSAPPAGANITPAGSYCAGNDVPVLGTVASGQGHWFTPNGNGTFVPVNSPNAVYQSSILDAGQNIQLVWVVSSTKCPDDSNFVTINFLNSLVSGSFALSEDTLCVENSTSSLNGIVTQGTGSWSTINGSGFFIPSINATNAVYQSVTNDQNKDIVICWNLTNSGCDTTKICDTIFVKSKPSGGFPIPPQNICISDTTDTLFAFVNFGYGKWTSNGSGHFLNPDTNVTRYVPGPLDGNQTITLTWNVISDLCDTVKYNRNFYVYDLPSGSFNTQLPDICVGELTPPLGATVSSGIGFWSTNGGGGFTNTTNPNASYIAVAADGNQIIDIYWNVFNGGCDTIQYVQQLQVDAPPVGTFNTILGTVCEGDISIPLGATVTNGLGFWTSQGPGAFVNVNDPNTVFIPGDVGSDTTFFLEWNVINGVCNPVTYTRSIRVLNSPAGTFDVPVDTTCPGVPTNILQATVQSGNGLWTTSGLGNFTNTTSGNAQYIPSILDQGQDIILTWNIFNGTCDTLKLSQTVHVLALPNTYAGADTTICPNDTVQLQASGANAYLWFPPIGLSDPTIANPLAVLSTSQTYIVKGFVSANCYTEDTLVITVNPGGSITAPPDVQICRGDSIQLNATGSNIIAWEWSPTDGLSDPNISNPMASPQNTTVYTVTGVTTSGCKVTDMVIVNVIPFTAPVIYGFDACQGNYDFYIYAIKDPTCGNAYWFNGSIQEVLSSPGGLSPSNPRFINSADSIPVNASNLGNYVFTLACVNTSTGCIGLDEFDLDVIAYPIASFTSDKTLCTYDDRTVQFTSTSTNAVFHYWQFGDPTTGDLNWDTLPNPVHTFSGPGKYSIALFVLNELGCPDLFIFDDYIEVALPNYYFPTAFSPNGDGLNDIFRALPPNSANVLSMKIWDRWGNLIYESENDNKGWTGYTSDGKPFDPGTYTYKVLIQLPQKSEPTVYTGYVTLIR